MMRRLLIVITIVVMLQGGMPDAWAVEPSQAVDTVRRPAGVFSAFDISWRDFGEFLSIVGAVAFIVWLWLKAKIAGDFVSRSEFSRVDERIETLEQTVERLPGPDSVLDLSSRVAQVENRMAVIGEQVNGVKALLERIDYSVKLLVKHQLSKGGE